ncbi:MAG TPA: cupin domain-containing protein [Thermomicrobiales bacterium]|nr:cupin domain-containing protein [Thermomicrobiales bacterium]
MGAHPTAAEIIQLLDLQPLAGEGGYFRQTLFVPNEPDAPGGNPLATAIVFLVSPTSWSGLHRLVTDELFHFYLGDPCRMVVCSPDGVLEERCLGTNLRSGCRIQTLVPGGHWQGTMLHPDGEFGYALLGTTMTPGFRQDQFTLATETDLAALPESVAGRLQPFLAANQEQPG